MSAINWNAQHTITEQDFREIIGSTLVGMDLLEQHDTLADYYNWIKKILDESSSERESKYTFCPSCHRWVLNTDINPTSMHRITTRGTETVFVSLGGYGDDDEIATVTREIIYQLCPRCGGNMYEKSNTVTKEENRRTMR